MTKDFFRNFLENTDETGRFIYCSIRTGKKYFVEVIGDSHIEWGSYNPASGKIEHKKGADKFTGSISPSNSLITEENCINIETLPIGTSPFSYIEKLDSKYPNKCENQG